MPIDQPVTHRWGRMAAIAKNTGCPLPGIDGPLAATAIHANMSLVTRDDTYSGIAGLSLLNPW